MVATEFLADILESIFEKHTIDDLSLKNGVDYRLLGLIWQNIVEKHLSHNKHHLSQLLDVSKYSVTFKHKVMIDELNLEKLGNTSQDYFVLDGYISASQKNYTSTIVEIKLGLQNIGIKEMEYLYYHPDANMICILYYPDRISRLQYIYDNVVLPLVSQFNKQYEPPVKFDVPPDRIIFVDRSGIDLDHISEKKLREYQTRVDYYSKVVIQLLYNVYPNNLIKEDLQTLTDAHHEVIGNILQNLLSKSVIERKVCDILNSINRVSKDIELFRLRKEVIDHPIFQDLITNTEDTQLLDNYDAVERKCIDSTIRKNDQSILCYLSHYPHRWIAVPDLLDNVTFSSQGELRRRLAALVDEELISTQRGYLLDRTNSRTKSYQAHFYRIVTDLQDRPDSCVCRHQPPTRINSPLKLTLTDLTLILFLKAHDVNRSNPIAITDLATSVDLNRSTVQLAVQRLSQTELPVATRNGWVLSQGKRTRMRSSPVVFLDHDPPEVIDQLASDLDLAAPPCHRRLQILSFPITPNEAAVVRAVARGLDRDQLYQTIKINPVAKSNRSMISAIIKRLSCGSLQDSRGIPPLLQQDPLRLCDLYLDHPRLNSHLVAMEQY